MKFLTLLSLLLLLAADLLQGMATSSRGRCLCVGPGASAVHPKAIAKVEIFGQTSSCEQVEVIVTLKGNGKRRCLNNKSKQASRMIQKLLKRSK
nr:C-X-C motif chemokine 11 [Pelodiscus sinensis]WCC60350.1 CXCL11 [Pelodiscus sinensis]|eukprot:XP_006133968.2 C-X-C motif chemokine 11 [Pelodiscus sinensis]